MGKHRVAITGIGVISALGQNSVEFWTALQRGCSGIRPIERVERSQIRFQNGAEVHDYNPLDYFGERQADLLDRFAQFAVIAAREAVADAGLEAASLPEKTSVITGSCVGGQDTMDHGFVEMYIQGRSRPHPLSIPKIMANAGASHISMELGVTGPGFTVSSACSSSNHALGTAYWMIAHGMAELAISGGSEAPFSTGHLKAWDAVRVVAPDTCRPFSKGRQGMILGEGGAMMILEPLEAALARGARIYGEIVGFGMSSDAHHLTQPSKEGGLKAMRSALEDAGLEADSIGYINAHGTGTLANDATESRAIRVLMGRHADEVAVSSTKSMHGHTLGAAGAVETIATTLALYYGVLPPTINYLGSDPECDIDVVPNEAREKGVEYALSNSFAFGGLNAVLALRRWSG